MLQDQWNDVQRRIHAACQRVGRNPSSITLVGVTKTVAVEAIREAVRLGLTDIGENRVQEAEVKRNTLKDEPVRLRWHLIGHLQRNKARKAVALFDIIHSVDSPELVQDLALHAQASGRTLPVLIQVNVSGEAAKSGCRPDAALPLAEAVTASAHLRLEGLMTIPPFADDPQQSRPYFRSLRELRDKLGSPLKLSMGMSHDLEVAIEEGSDFIRVGQAIFGERSVQ